MTVVNKVERTGMIVELVKKAVNYKHARFRALFWVYLFHETPLSFSHQFSNLR